MALAKTNKTTEGMGMKNLAKTTLILTTGVTSTLHNLTQKRELNE